MKILVSSVAFEFVTTDINVWRPDSTALQPCHSCLLGKHLSKAARYFPSGLHIVEVDFGVSGGLHALINHMDSQRFNFCLRGAKWSRQRLSLSSRLRAA